jgi:hypothetical protein
LFVATEPTSQAAKKMAQMTAIRVMNSPLEIGCKGSVMQGLGPPCTSSASELKVLELRGVARRS